MFLRISDLFFFCLYLAYFAAYDRIMREVLSLHFFVFRLSSWGRILCC